MKPGEDEKQGQEQQTKPAGKPEDNGETRNDQVAEGKLPPSQIAELLRKILGTEQWGFLPRKLREDIGSGSATEYPREYRDIIARYYERLGKVLSGK